MKTLVSDLSIDLKNRAYETHREYIETYGYAFSEKARDEFIGKDLRRSCLVNHALEHYGFTPSFCQLNWTKSKLREVLIKFLKRDKDFERQNWEACYAKEKEKGGELHSVIVYKVNDCLRCYAIEYIHTQLRNNKMFKGMYKRRFQYLDKAQAFADDRLEFHSED